MKRSAIRHNKSAILLQPSRDKRRVLSSSKSPVRVVNGIRLFNFSNIDSYRMINKPYLNSQKSEMIKAKLDLEKSAWQFANQRMKKGREFVNFNFNPFNQNRNLENKAKNFDETAQLQKKNIIHEINVMRHKKIDRKYFDALHNKKEEANKFSNFVRKQSTTLKHSKSAIVQPRKKEINPVANKVKKSQKQPELSLQQIMHIEQENGFKDRYKSINIFRVLFHKEQFFMEKKQLENYRFCFNSIVQKNSQSKIPIYRDLSRQARGLVNKKPSNLLDENQEFVHDKIKFQDLINVSAGRYTPEYIYQQINAFNKYNVDQFYSVSEDELDQEFLKRTKYTLTENKHQEHRQIEQYKQLLLNKDELKYQKLCEYRKSRISANLRKEQDLANASIYDKTMHKQIKQEVRKDLENFVCSDFKYPKTIIERNRRVRENKQGKNRKEIVKMKALLQTFFLKKHNDQLINRLIINRK